MRFQRQVRERRLARGPCAQCLDVGGDRRLLGQRKVLPHDRMPQHRQRALGEVEAGHCLGGVAAVQRAPAPDGRR